MSAKKRKPLTKGRTLAKGKLERLRFCVTQMQSIITLCEDEIGTERTMDLPQVRKLCQFLGSP